jgi:hypothetical protein
LKGIIHKMSVNFSANSGGKTSSKVEKKDQSGSKARTKAKSSNFSDSDTQMRRLIADHEKMERNVIGVTIFIVGSILGLLRLFGWNFLSKGITSMVEEISERKIEKIMSDGNYHLVEYASNSSGVLYKLQKIK